MKKNNKNQKNHIVQAIVHCTSCRGIVIKNIEAENLEGKLFFLVRCPHCTKDCKVTVIAKKSVETSLE